MIWLAGIILLILVVSIMFVRELRWQKRRQPMDNRPFGIIYPDNVVYDVMLSRRLWPYFVFFGILVFVAGLVIYAAVFYQPPPHP